MGEEVKNIIRAAAAAVVSWKIMKNDFLLKTVAAAAGRWVFL